MKVVVEFNTNILEERALLLQLFNGAPVVSVHNSLGNISTLVVPEVPPPPPTPVASLHVPPPPPPAADSAEDEAPDANAPLVDNFGVAHDTLIHNSNKRIYDASGKFPGRFFKKRGVHDAVYEKAYADRTLITPLAGAVPAAPAALPAATHPLHSAPAGHVPPPPSTAVPPPPAATVAPQINSFPQFVQFVQELLKRKVSPLTEANVQAVLTEYNCKGLPHVGQLAQQQPGAMQEIANKLAALAV